MINVRQLGLFAAFTCSCAAAAGAQTTSTPPPPDEMTAITVSGCVQRNTTPSASSEREAIGSTGTRPDSPLILVDARGKKAAAVTPAAELVTSAVTSYRLAGGGKLVAENIGRRVEIAGTVDKRDPAIEQAVTGRSGAAPLPPMLTITMLTPLTGTCAK
jgi:hypothetical protein